MKMSVFVLAFLAPSGDVSQLWTGPLLGANGMRQKDPNFTTVHPKSKTRDLSDSQSAHP